MDIKKEELFYEYVNGDYESFFRNASEIARYIILREYNIDPEDRDDLQQDCMCSLWMKHIENKIQISKSENLMAFIWRNSTFTILDYLKKKNRREKKIRFVSYDEVITDISTTSIKNVKCYRYSPDNIAEYD